LGQFVDSSHVEIRLEELTKRFNALQGFNIVPTQSPENRKLVKQSFYSPGKYGYMFSKDYATSNPSMPEYKKAVSQDLNLYWPVLPSHFVKLLEPNHAEDMSKRWLVQNRERVYGEIDSHILKNTTPTEAGATPKATRVEEGAESPQVKSLVFLPKRELKENRLATSKEVRTEHGLKVKADAEAEQKSKAREVRLAEEEADREIAEQAVNNPSLLRKLKYPNDEQILALQRHLDNQIEHARDAISNNMDCTHYHIHEVIQTSVFLHTPIPKEFFSNEHGGTGKVFFTYKKPSEKH
jgi:hypothetical protein